MRGGEVRSGSLFSYVDLEARVPRPQYQHQRIHCRMTRAWKRRSLTEPVALYFEALLDT